jgi:hypothetical protein
MDGCVEMQSDSFDPLDALRPLFVAWFDARIRLDLRWSTAVGTFHGDCCGWMLERSQTVPPTREEFIQMLRELCCAFCDLNGEELVVGLALPEDIAAQRDFPAIETEPPKPSKPPKGAAPDATPAGLSDPDDLPALPRGVVLVRWEPKNAPIRLSHCSTVTDTDKFIRATLIQLDHQLQGRTWLAGNWGPQGLLDRLAACGCVVQLEDARRLAQ